MILNENIMKKYLLLVEDEKLWNEFKKEISKDINTEIMELIKKKVKILLEYQTLIFLVLKG